MSQFHIVFTKKNLRTYRYLVHLDNSFSFLFGLQDTVIVCCVFMIFGAIEHNYEESECK
jgi:hypothetical protein